MKKIILSLFILSAIFPFSRAVAASVDTEQLLKQITPPASVLKEEGEKKGRWNIDSYYEHSKIVQGSRPGRWKEITNRLAYAYSNLQVYTTVSQWQRFDVKNYNAYAGSYINFPNSYVHLELGWGWDTTYMYKFQSIAEYGHRINKGLYWQAGYSFRDYSDNDNYIIYPGLIYYFGDNYISADYGLSLIEGRGAAHFGVVRGNFALGKKLSCSLGTAVGERLYDIYELSATKEYGYIFFTGFNYQLLECLNAKIGFSYGTERPDFIKRSLNLGLSLKF